MSNGTKRLTVLGATGSIGASTLDVVARHPDRYEVFALSGHRRVDELALLCRRFAPRFAAVPDAEAAGRVWRAVEDGSMTRAAWDEYVAQLRREGRVSAPAAPAAPAAPPSTPTLDRGTHDAIKAGMAEILRGMK